jgi:hypothetical protein
MPRGAAEASGKKPNGSRHHGAKLAALTVAEKSR